MTFVFTARHCARAQDYATAEEFFDAILSSWQQEWDRVYSCDWAQSRPFEDGGVDYAIYYNPSIKILSVLSQGALFGDSRYS